VSVFLSPEEDRKLTKFVFDTFEQVDDFDEEMIPYLEILNDIPGIVSCYSCAGHNRSEDDKGYILFYVSKEMFDILVDKIYPYLYNKFLDIDPTAIELGFNYLEEKVRMSISWKSKYFKQIIETFTYELLLIEKENCGENKVN